jgi:hypothetical protein
VAHTIQTPTKSTCHYPSSQLLVTDLHVSNAILTLSKPFGGGVCRFLLAVTSAGKYNVTLVATGASTSRHVISSITIVPGMVDAHNSFISGEYASFAPPDLAEMR